ncbi:hypothetical protein F5I97DRAFT_1093424 [Phlebopus sp. FC_14]|nr:hypothetical protein F5I97DRAFT_1093424 [Phlebopus sp. FC_14]
MPAPTSLYSSALFAALTIAPFVFSLLSYTSALFRGRPLSQFLCICMPYLWTYYCARWYIMLAQKSSPLNHPCGCLAQCLNWVVHWMRATYYAFFGEYRRRSWNRYSEKQQSGYAYLWFTPVNVYTPETYPTTIPCMLVILLAEGQFYNMISFGCNTDNLGVYGRARRRFGRVLESVVRAWFSTWDVRGEAPPRRRRLRTSRTM